MPPKRSSAASKAKPKSESRGPSTPIRFYLIVFNLVSFFGWVLILSTLVKHLLIGPQTASLPLRYLERALAPIRPFRVFLAPTYRNVKPAWVREVLSRASVAHQYLGPLVAGVQSLAILEVVHAALGWVRSPVPTTAIQVASRLFMVWIVSERYDEAAISPWYASMVLAWSITESIRYPFYANQLMGADGDGLLWLRYTTFYILYPLGAGSEAMTMFSTLSSTLPDASWTPREWIFGALFVIWWPGLYIMYTHMMKQRTRALGRGFWGDKLAQQKLEAAKAAKQRESGTKAVADASWASGTKSGGGEGARKRA